MIRFDACPAPGRVAAAAMGAFFLVGCAGLPGADSERSAESVIYLQPYEELQGDAADPSTSCKVGFRYVYPPDLPVSQREVYYQTGRESESGVTNDPMGRAGGPLELPRPERDPRPVQRDDGMMALDVRIRTYGPCRDRRTGETPVVAFTIGDCVAGECPPMRYQAPATEIVRFRLIEE